MLKPQDYALYHRKFNCGWNKDYDDSERWYPPGENLPMPLDITSTTAPQITLSFIMLISESLELQIRQGDKKWHILFDAMYCDGMPGLAFFLKCLIKHGYGHYSHVDHFEGYALRLSVWSNSDGTAYMRCKYSATTVYDSDNFQWDGKTNINAIIRNIQEFLNAVLNDPYVISEYIYPEWDAHEEFDKELKKATQEFLATLPGENVVQPNSAAPTLKDLVHSQG